MKKIFFIVFGFLFLIGVYFFNNQQFFFRPKESPIPRGMDMKSAKVEIVAEKLDIPWAIGFLPDGSMLVTERSGNLLKVKDDLKIPVAGVKHVGEGGLLGMALHPNFAENHYLYLYLTTEGEASLENRVERYVFENDQLSERKVILEGIPGAKYHDGGFLAFGPDKLLYVTTGDANDSDNAQNADSLAGKILRMRDDGSNLEIFSMGHRNVQGITWDDKGQLWATEHGRSGAASGFDELNLIEKGENYGWPIVEGDAVKEGFKKPVVHSGEEDTWAPGQIVFYGGKLFFSGLRGESLYEFSGGALKRHFFGDFGRLRALTIGMDGYFYFSTSNTDGRGEPRKNDDKIVKVHPSAL